MAREAAESAWWPGKAGRDAQCGALMAAKADQVLAGAATLPAAPVLLASMLAGVRAAVAREAAEGAWWPGKAGRDAQGSELMAAKADQVLAGAATRLPTAAAEEAMLALEDPTPFCAAVREAGAALQQQEADSERAVPLALGNAAMQLKADHGMRWAGAAVPAILVGKESAIVHQRCNFGPPRCNFGPPRCNFGPLCVTSGPLGVTSAPKINPHRVTSGPWDCNFGPLEL